MEIIYKNPKDLIPYEKNTKVHDKTQIDNVAESIKQFGFVQPVVIDKDNVIVIGHCRTLAAKKLKMETVPCVLVDTLTEEQIRALRIVDNKTNESPWEMNFLKDELKDTDLLGFDFDFGFEDDEPDTDIIEDVAPEVDEEEEPTAKLGQIYKLGNHRLMCGDSTKEEDVKALMDGAEASLLLTDPPYGVDYSSKQNAVATILNKNEGTHRKNNRKDIKQDNMNDTVFDEFLTTCFTNAYEVLKPGGSFCIWYASSRTICFFNALNKCGFKIHQPIIWVKDHLVLGMSDYQNIFEPCIYGWKPGAAHYFINNRTLTNVIDDKPNFETMKKEDMKMLLENIYKKTEPFDVIYERKPYISMLHPTMKPVGLFARLIKNSSKRDDDILDLFGGSGTTLMACEQLGRNCYMMEYDPHYVDVIIERWENFTGQKAELIN